MGDEAAAAAAVDMQEERAHFAKVLRAWSDYLQYTVRAAAAGAPLTRQLSMNNWRRTSLFSLPRAHQALLQDVGPPVPGPLLEHGSSSGERGLRARLDEMDDRIRRNADVLEQVAQFCRTFLGLMEGEPGDGANESGAQSSHAASHSVSEHDQDRIRTALRQMARDWSAEGAEERERVYTPILEAVTERYPQLGSEERRAVRVLVPGAGMGRLAFDFAAQGFSTQGNEFSYYMLLPSHFLLNNTACVNEHVIYPYVHSVGNWRTAGDMLRPVRIPDVLPASLPPDVEFSMVAGDFVEVYAKPEERGAWDVVATCYFLDTARNVVRFLEVINAVLPLGGLWVNAGPLLWHFEHDEGLSIELTLDELLDLLGKLGFVLEERRTLPAQTYTGNTRGMLRHEYVPEFWVCRKVREHEMAPAV